MRETNFVQYLLTFNELKLLVSRCRLGSDPMQLFPYEALQAQLQQFGKYGLIMFTLLLPMLISTAEATPDLDEITEKLQHNPSQLFKPDATLFNKRMRDVVVDMDRLGYI